MLASYQASLPFGYNSTFLEAAVKAGTVPSKQFSIWPGISSVDSPVDGLVIVGGYDEARVKGDFSNFTAYSNSPFFVEITDVMWESSPGNVTSLFSNATAPLYGNIEPFFRTIFLPPDVYTNFQSASNGTYNATLGELVYNSSSIPTGKLTITLSNGYRTEISGSDLFDYPQDYDNTGVEAVTNWDLVYAKVQNYDYYPEFSLALGVPFMTMNYVIADYENDMFMMAPAVREDFGQSTARNLQPLCTQNHPPPPPPPPPPHPPPPHNSTAAIAGGVGGGVGGLLLIGGLIALFFCLRRRKRRAAAQHRQQPSPADRKTVHSPTTETSELPSPPPQHVAHWLSTQPGRDHEEVSDIGGSPSPFLSYLHPHRSPVILPLCFRRNQKVHEKLTKRYFPKQGPEINKMSPTSGPFEMPAQHPC